MGEKSINRFRPIAREPLDELAKILPARFKNLVFLNFGGPKQNQS